MDRASSILQDRTPNDTLDLLVDAIPSLELEQGVGRNSDVS